MADIAKAYVQIVPSARGMKQGLANIFGNEMPSAGKSAGGIFGSSLIGTIKTALISAGIGQTLKSTILEGADLQQSLGGVETMFKESADKVIANANMAWKTAGLSANSYMEQVTSFSASLLQSLAGDTEEAAIVADMALTDMSDNANKFGSDMERITDAYQGFAKQNYTMLDNLKLGYGGTKTEMQRLLADAQKLSGVKYDINNLSDVYKAIHVIQKELGVTGTTGKEAANTLTGSFNAMKASFSNVMASIVLGMDMSQPLNALATSTVTFLKGNFAPAVTNIVTALPGTLKTFITELLPGDVKDVVDLAGNKFTGAVGDNLPMILDSGESTMESYTAGISGKIPSLQESGIEIVDRLAAYVVEKGGTIITTGAETLSSFMGGVANAIPGLFDTATSVVDSLASYVIANAGTVLSSGGELLVSIGTGIGNALPELTQTAINVVSSLSGYLVDHAGDIASGAAEIGKAIAEGIWDSVVAVWNSIANIPGLLDGIAFGVSVNTGIDVTTPSASLIRGTQGALGMIDFAAIRGSYATGLDYVPFDNFVAALHEGEMVLTKEEATRYRRGSGSSTSISVIQNIYSEAKSAADLMEEARYQQELAVILGV